MRARGERAGEPAGERREHRSHWERPVARGQEPDREHLERRHRRAQRERELRPPRREGRDEHRREQRRPAERARVAVPRGSPSRRAALPSATSMNRSASGRRRATGVCETAKQAQIAACAASCSRERVGHAHAAAQRERQRERQEQRRVDERGDPDSAHEEAVQLREVGVAWRGDESLPKAGHGCFSIGCGPAGIARRPAGFRDPVRAMMSVMLDDLLARRPVAPFPVELRPEQVDEFRTRGFTHVARITSDAELAWLGELYDWLFSERKRGRARRLLRPVAAIRQRWRRSAAAAARARGAGARPAQDGAVPERPATRLAVARRRPRERARLGPHDPQAGAHRRAAAVAPGRGVLGSGLRLPRARLLDAARPRDPSPAAA